jgi:hypothetical protein
VKIKYRLARTLRGRLIQDDVIKVWEDAAAGKPGAERRWREIESEWETRSMMSPVDPRRWGGTRPRARVTVNPGDSAYLVVVSDKRCTTRVRDGRNF